MQKLFKFRFRDRKRILLLTGVGDKIVSPRENFPDGAYLSRDMLDAVKDHVILIAEDNIAVFSHELDHDELSSEVAHLIKMLHLNPDDPLQPRLGDRDDPAIGDMLS